MKKYLFFATAVFAGLSLKAQTVYVADNTGVKVGSSTLFYVNGGVTLANSTTNNQKFSNEGNVRIEGTFTNNDQTGKNFVDEAKSGQYGQLIVIGSTTGSGKLTSQVKFNNGFDFQAMAIPYIDLKAKDFIKQAYANTSNKDVEPSFIASTSSTYNENRYKNPLFLWNNNIYSADNLDATTSLSDPTSFYEISNYSNMGRLNSTAFSSLSGTIFKDEKQISVQGYMPESNKAMNKYGEAYGSYIVDFTATPPSGWVDFYTVGKPKNNSNGYGASIYFFGNPYTSNIDLSKGEGFIPTNNNYKTVLYQESSSRFDANANVAAASSFSSPIISTSEGTGDNLKYARPFQTFLVKVFKKETNGRAKYIPLPKGESYNFKFTNNMKTFGIEGDKSVNVLYLKNKSFLLPKVNQVGLDLYDDKGNNTEVRTYVVASNIYEASQKGTGVEAYNIGMSDDVTGIYTLQEAEDGSIDQTLKGSKTYINGVNAEKYIAKPIHLVFQNGKGSYKLKVRLNETLKSNKNSFYLEDKKDKGKVYKLTDGEVIPLTVNGTEKDRFVLYWAAIPKNNLEKDLTNGISNTLIYKDEVDHYRVRFGNSMNKADIFVYNISGQLVFIKKQVNTKDYVANDFPLNIQGNASVYIVKVVGDDGEVVTKKIIK